MLLIPVQDLVEGDLLGKGLYTPDGRLMLKQGIRLNDRMIEGIKRLGQHYIYVEMADHRASETGWDWKTNLRSLTEDLLTRCFESVRRNDGLPVKPIFDWADHLSGLLAEKTEVKIGPADLSQEREELIAHSLNVCFLSVMTAKALGYRENELRDVAIGSLLHDIGLAVPLEDKLVLNHPMIGFDVLRRLPGLSIPSLQIVLQHHERIDGRGFPHGIRGDAFRQPSQICALASEFDDFMNRSLTPRTPCEGFDFVMSKIDNAYDYSVVRAFLNVFEPYPVGTAVTLTGSLEGTVVETNPGCPSRPIIRLRATGDRFDLMQHTTFRIERAVPAIT
ncbi:HD-GYP domain-containing protein [Cohnella candidum]|uniref:HD domain-containing protein n=1 Tax=Cohnella candidum TaxID=2674991 RepID=A0A3G3JZF1_9BACL|nr:HD domain-containing phosphohydrolase [Cohnella candidum]AYQ73241.1 HD domain-containing protein [Cohnella candidum]